MAESERHGYDSQRESPLSNVKLAHGGKALGLAQLSDLVLQLPDIEGLSRLLTESLPKAVGVTDATLLYWDRKLESFEELPRGGKRHLAPEARYLISEGEILETHGKEDAALVPLMARSGLIGMLVLGRRRGRRPYSAAEVRNLSSLADRAALALENHLYQRELIASERMAALGTMAGMLAHDFRGPMTVIRGYAETLLEEDQPLSRQEVKERAELICRMVDRLERMTAETLDFARGGAKVALRTVGLATTLKDIAEGLPLEFPGLKVAADVKVDPSVRASLDVDKLKRAVGNLAANSRDAMGGSGQLHFGADMKDGRLLIVVSDEGPGVPEGIKDRLFEPFVTQGKKQGTGLGLAVTRRFVEDHGGRVELLAQGPGAHFLLTLPLKPPV